MPSLTTENYIKAIYQLAGHGGEETASTGAIAAKLAVSPGSVTAMLKTLRDADLVRYEPYEGVQLTDSGKRLALRVLRRHRLIELFLVQTLELPWDEVHEEAEHMEHAVSDRLIDHIDAHLGFPDSDPHGDPIPKSDGTVEMSEGESLTLINEGHGFELVRVLDQSSDFLRFLTQSGLELGAKGRVIHHAAHAATTTIEVNGSITVLSVGVADKLIVIKQLQGMQ